MAHLEDPTEQVSAQEASNRLIDSLESSFREAAGCELYEGAQRLKRWIEAHLYMLDATQSRAELEELFAGAQGEEAVTEMLAFSQLFQVFNPLLQAWIMQNARTVAAENAAPAGPPTKATPAVKREIISFISNLVKGGLKIGPAQTRAELKFNLGKRTIQRIWRDRGKFTREPFQDMDDVFRFLSE